MKYIIGINPVGMVTPLVFNAHLRHRDVAKVALSDCTIFSAGVCSIVKGKVKCCGESRSLEAKCSPNDEVLLEGFFEDDTLTLTDLPPMELPTMLVGELEKRIPISRRMRVTLNNAINKAQDWLDRDGKNAAATEKFWRSKEGSRHIRFRRALEVLIAAAKPNLNRRVKEAK